MAEINQILQGRYRIITLLGRGGMGAVYLAHEIQLDTDCVVKEMLPQNDPSQGKIAAEQFLREAKTLAGLRHPNLPRVSHFFEEGGSHYLVMDLIEGLSLDKMIGAQAMPESVVLKYACQLLDVLEYIHEHGVVHRDIKPANIIITSKAQAVLVDFGLAKVSGKTIVRGYTEHFSPPEAAGGGTDLRGDLYSLAATMYKALSGKTPIRFTADSDEDVLLPLRQIRPEVSENTARVIMKCMTLDRKGRYQTAAEMRTDLFNPTPTSAQAKQAQMAATAPASEQTVNFDPAKARLGVPQVQGVPPPTPIGVSHVAPPPVAKKPPVVGIILGAVGVVIVLVIAAVVIAGRTPKPAVDATPASPTPVTATTKEPATAKPGVTNTRPAKTTPSVTDTPGVGDTIEPTFTRLPTRTPRATLRASATPVPAAGTTQRVAFARGAVGCSVIVVRDINTGAETILKSTDRNEEAAWSPDGTTLVASTGNCSGGNQNITLFDIQSQNSAPLVNEGSNLDPFWGSDNRIYFVRSIANSFNGTLYSIVSDGNDLRAIGIEGRKPRLSPDGSRLAFMKWEGSYWRIHVVDIDSAGQVSNERALALPSAPGGVHARMPNWGQDSDHLYFNITNSSFDSVALGIAQLSNGFTGYDNQKSSTGDKFGRPSCGKDNWCVVNTVSTGGIWLLRQTGNAFKVDRQLTNGDDWGPAIYP